MSKRTFPWIIGLAAVALLGLILMQLTWINAAVELEQSRFSQRVQGAMQRVVENTEQLEMAAKIAEVISGDSTVFVPGNDVDVNVVRSQDGAILRDSSSRTALQVLRILSTRLEEVRAEFDGMSATDSLQESVQFEVYQDIRRDSLVVHQSIAADQLNINSELLVSDADTSNVQLREIRVVRPQEIDNHVHLDADLEWHQQMDDHSDDHQNGLAHDGAHAQSGLTIIQEFTSGDSGFKMVIGMPDSMVNVPQSDYQSQRVRAYARSSDKLLQELSAAAVPVYERIDTNVLRQQLRAELNNRGIKAPFNMAIETPHKNIALNTQTISGPAAPDMALPNAEKSERVYRTVLFPSDIVRASEQLMLEFPDQQQHILLSMGLNLGASLLFLLLLIGCFAFTLYALVQQKKISDIKTDFINNMTHEFKTPISTISLASEALLEPAVVDSGKRVKRFANVIYAENKRLEHQVERALQAALMDRGQLELQLQSVDVHALIAAAADTLRVRLEPLGGTLDVKLESSKATLPGDEVHLENVIHNLLDNAEKYSDKAPQISVRTYSRNDKFYLEVSDKGLGLSREARRRIFDKFYRVPTGNVHDVKGFGLGLSYVHDIVKAHSGSVDVSSELGQGATFTVMLPLNKYQNSTGAGEREDATPQTSSSPNSQQEEV